jgi:chromosome segregation ATPase
MDKHVGTLMFEGLFEFLGQNQKDVINISDIHNQINTAQKLILSLDTKTNEQKDIFYKNLDPLKGSLTSLRGNHNLFQDQISASFDKARSQNSEFHEATNQSLEILRQKIDGYGTQVSSLNKQGESLNEQIASRLQNFQAGITEFQSILESTKNEFEARKENLLGKLESMALLAFR